MKFEEILNHKLFKSIPERGGKSYRDYLFEILDSYLGLINNLELTGSKGIAKNINVNIDSVINYQTSFVGGIKEALDSYLDGKPFESYKIFEKTMNDRLIKYKNLLKTDTFENETNFFRIRETKENYLFSQNDMFHIPFHLRGKISTQRYSIPGYPSLYLSKTLYVCWEEMKRPKIDEFQAIRLKSTKKIKYLDLALLKSQNNSSKKESYKYLITWPLIIACSVKVLNPSDTFKSEYIIPQLLLQWVRMNRDIDAIKYSSTHIDYSNIEDLKDLYNIVMPVKDNKDKGYCNHLKTYFEMTEAISWQFYQMTNAGGSAVLYRSNELKEYDDKIPHIELVKGIKLNYGSSIFGALERHLEFSKTRKLDF
jgi:hypothetical protein